MKCPNCGRENPDDYRFCSVCGTSLTFNKEPYQQETYQQKTCQQNPYPPYQEPSDGTLGGSNDTVLKIFGTVLAVLYAGSFLWALYGVMTGILALFHYYGIGLGVTRIIICVLKAAACAVMCVMLLLLAHRRTRENTEGLLYGLVLAGIFRIAAGIVALVLNVFLKIWRPWWTIGWTSLFVTFLCTVVAVGAMALILLLSNEYTYMPHENGEWREVLSQLPGTISDALHLGARNQAAYPGGQTYGNGQPGYTGQTYGSSQPGYTGQTYGSSQPGYTGQTYGNGQPGYTGAAPQSGWQNGYQQPGGIHVKPAFCMKTDRSLGLYILFSILTCGIYGYYFLYTMARDANTICEGDGRKTGGLLAFIFLSLLTCGFYGVYWEYSLGNRLAENAPRYGLSFQENGTSVLLWHIFGVLICGIGPFIAMNILIKNMNRLSVAYNEYNRI